MRGRRELIPTPHLKRPHIAGTAEGLGGENIVMTYCALTRLGLGYKPEIDGSALSLEPVAQHGNNLLLKEVTTCEPIQQIYGTRECDRESGRRMQPWPTYRMTLRGFHKAFPEGEVFLNPVVPFFRNPFLWVFDTVMEMVFLWGTVPHHHGEKLLFETLSVEDDRLPRKTLVWGATVEGKAIAFTEERVRESDRPVNVQVGGKHIVAAYDEAFESLGVFYNPSGQPVSTVDFWGDSNRGRLSRVETLGPGVYWCVWVNFFPDTLLEARAIEPSEAQESATDNPTTMIASAR